MLQPNSYSNVGFTAFPTGRYTTPEIEPHKRRQRILRQVQPARKDPLQSGTRSAPNKMTGLSDETLTVLGENGLRRIEEFRRYPQGWYGGKGDRLSTHSISIFDNFIKRIPELRLFAPSVFLSLSGFLSIGFEDKTGKQIEIEFFPDRIEYFAESLYEESSVGISKSFELADKIRHLLK